jgi:hypothetical protein
MIYRELENCQYIEDIEIELLNRFRDALLLFICIIAYLRLSVTPPVERSHLQFGLNFSHRN